MPRNVLLVVAITLLGVICSVRTAYAGPETATDLDARAEKLFRDGRKAIVRKDWPAAHKLLDEAYRLKQSFDIAAMLGQVEYELKRYRDAAEHIEYSLRHFPPKEDEEPRSRLKAWLDESKQHVAILKVHVTPEGARVRIDKKSVGLAPLGAPAFVNPGSRVVEAELAGHQKAQRSMEVGAGQEVEITLALKPESGGPGAGRPAGTDGTPDGGPANSNRSITPAIVAGGVAVIGLGLGIGFALSAQGKASDADELADKVGETGCTTGAATKADCTLLGDKNEAADRHSRFAVAGFSVFAVSTAVTVTYLLWPTDEGSATSRKHARGLSKAELRPSAVFDSHSAALMLSGFF